MAFHLMVIGGFILEKIPDGSADKPLEVVEGATAMQEAPKGNGRAGRFLWEWRRVMWEQ